MSAGKNMKNLPGFENDSSSSDEEEPKMDLDSSSDSDDSSSEEEEDRAEIEKQLNEVNTQLEPNPLGYDLLVKKIQLLRRLGDPSKVREVREKMNEYYPLSPQLWLDWVKDEIELAKTDEAKESIIPLFERGVQEYLSVELWLEYASFMMNFMGKENGIQRCRDVFERALTAGGLHVSLGPLIWLTYRDFEGALLGTQTTEEDRVAQEQRYSTLCRRQLSVPLLGMKEALEDIEDKIDVDEKARESYENALRKLKMFQSFETKLVEPSVDDDKKAKIYQNYIATEVKDKSNPARIQCLYERAVADCPLNSELWSQYLAYLTTSLKIQELSQKVAERATRNCPWILDLWIMRMNLSENLDSKTIIDIFQKAIHNFQSLDDVGRLWLKYLECLRRQLRSSNLADDAVEKFAANVQKAEDHILQLSAQENAEPEPNSYVFQFQMMLIRVQASRSKDLSPARTAWKELLQRGYGASFRNWLHVLRLEEKYGDLISFRKTISQAVAYVKDDLYTAADVWMNFERDNGDAAHLSACEQKISKYMQQLTVAELEQYNPPSGKNYPDKKKRKLPDNSDVPAPSKKRRDARMNADETGKTDSEGFKVPQLPSGSQGFNQKKAANATGDAPREKVVHDSSKDDRTVFVSNLAFTTDEKALELFFEALPIQELRLVRDFKGRSKGYAYIVFDAWESAEAALKKDRVGLDGRPVFVSKCDPNKSTRPPGFKFAVKLEKNKTFVKGLPLHYGKEDLEKLFSPFGTISDIRIVTFRNGHSKGIAYVEYQDEASAAKAVKEADGREIEGQAISVAISNPPPKRESSRNLPDDMKMMQRKAPTAFVPRSLQVSKSSKPGGSGAPMTNADFKELLKLKRPS